MSAEATPLGFAESRARFEDLIEGVLAPAARLTLEVHLGRCEGCAGELRAQERMRRAIREDLPRLRAPRHLRTRVQSVLAGERVGRWGTEALIRVCLWP